MKRHLSRALWPDSRASWFDCNISLLKTFLNIMQFDGRILVQNDSGGVRKLWRGCQRWHNVHQRTYHRITRRPRWSAERDPWLEQLIIIIIIIIIITPGARELNAHSKRRIGFSYRCRLSNNHASTRMSGHGRALRRGNHFSSSITTWKLWRRAVFHLHESFAYRHGTQQGGFTQNRTATFAVESGNAEFTNDDEHIISPSLGGLA